MIKRMIRYIRRKWNYHKTIILRMPSREVLIDEWLKYHNASVREVINKYPPERLETPEWLKMFPCTQRQHDDWNEWAKDYLTMATGYSREYIERKWGFAYLECAPYVGDSPQ